MFALGANYQTSGIRPTAFTDALIGAYVGHAAAQYAQISSTPDAWEAFSGKVFAMWGGQPAYTDEQLAGIGVPFVIAAGVYEEAIDEGHTKRMAELIPGRPAASDRQFQPLRALAAGRRRKHRDPGVPRRRVTETARAPARPLSRRTGGEMPG